MKQRILVCDDEPGLREMLAVQLRRLGHETVVAADSAQAAQALSAGEPFDVVVTDLVMPGGSGMDVLDRARSVDPTTQVIMMTAHASTPQAVEAMRRGAYDYLQKPFKMEEFRATLEKALEKRSLLRENAALRRTVDREFRELGIIGRSPAIARVRDLVHRMAASHASVLITGESGTGKEVVARALHAESPRRAAPFITVNCGAMPENLMESELFGHEKGAFTGAVAAKPGLFRAAHGGTLLLDEIGELPLALQVKLLRVLQERVVRPVGSAKDVSVDVRVLAATNRFLEEDVRRGAFRQDLYYRLNVLRIHLPPLRERREDIPLLARHFVEEQAAIAGRPFELTDEVAATLARRSFPGNVRELENAVLRATALARTDRLEASDFDDLDHGRSFSPGAAAGELGEGFDLDAHLSSIEKELIYRALDQSGGVRTQAAKLLGMSFRSFRYRIAKYEGGELSEETNGPDPAR